MYSKNSSASDSVSRYDERVEVAIDKALKLCDIQEEEDCEVDNCGDVKIRANCGADNWDNVEQAEGYRVQDCENMMTGVSGADSCNNMKTLWSRQLWSSQLWSSRLWNTKL